MGNLDIVVRLTLKLERAKKHILDLESEWTTFLKTKPYHVVFKDDLQTGERIYYVERVNDIPPVILVIVGDVLQNLRSALDHLATISP